MKKKDTPWTQIGDEIFVRNVPSTLYEANEKYISKMRILEVKKDGILTDEEKNNISDCFDKILSHFDYQIYDTMARFSVNSNRLLNEQSNEEIIALVKKELPSHPDFIIKTLPNIHSVCINFSP